MQTRQICLAIPPTGKTLKQANGREIIAIFSPMEMPADTEAEMRKIISSSNIVIVTHPFDRNNISIFNCVYT